MSRSAKSSTMTCDGGQSDILEKRPSYRMPPWLDGGWGSSPRNSVSAELELAGLLRELSFGTS